MNLHLSACDELRDWTPPAEPQRALRESFLAYLAEATIDMLVVARRRLGLGS